MIEAKFNSSVIKNGRNFATISNYYIEGLVSTVSPVVSMSAVTFIVSVSAITSVVSASPVISVVSTSITITSFIVPGMPPHSKITGVITVSNNHL